MNRINMDRINEKECVDKAIERLTQFVAPRLFQFLADKVVIQNILSDLYEDGYEAGYKDGQDEDEKGDRNGK